MLSKIVTNFINFVSSLTQLNDVSVAYIYYSSYWRTVFVFIYFFQS